ncbi:MAG: hypothetical protein IPN79_04160 [Saprospiraceae bacterium]|jgi:hypothetical protein|nr:hypothetical protein [Saprospiraceae bacterium]
MTSGVIINSKSFSQEYFCITNIISLILIFIFFNYYWLALCGMILYLQALTGMAGLRVIEGKLIKFYNRGSLWFNDKSIQLDEIEKIEIHYFDNVAFYLCVIVDISLKSSDKSIKINLGTIFSLAKLELLVIEFKKLFGEKVIVYN